MVFQIRDDVMDIVASESELGKLPGQDLAEGIYHPPGTASAARPGDRPEADLVARSPTRSCPGRDCTDARRQSNGIEAAAQVARRYAEEAAEAVSILGDGPVVKTLAALSYNLLDDLERSRALAS